MPDKISLSFDSLVWPTPATLLPHGSGACCVDRVVSFAPGKHVCAHWRVCSASHLFDPQYGGVPTWAGIEIMAQCAGLYLGLSRRYSSEPGAPRSGFLVGVRRFRALRPLLAQGDELLIEAACDTVHTEADELGIFDCRILCGDCVYADARLMLWCAGEETGGA